MKDLTECRAEIDRIDAEIQKLFEERMRTASDVAAYKKAHGLPVLDASREEAKLASLRGSASTPALGNAIAELYRTMMAVTRGYEELLTDGPDGIGEDPSPEGV